MGIPANIKWPKQHGAWGMLYVPFVIGVLVAGRISWSVLLLGLAVTGVFMARESLLDWRRASARGRDPGPARAAPQIFLGLAALSGAPLLFHYQLWGLVPFILLTLGLLVGHTEQAVRSRERTVFGEILAITGLTVTAPAAYYVALGTWHARALELWVLSGLYFTSSVFYVKLRVLTVHGREEARRQIRRRCGLYHAILAGSLLVLALADRLPLFALAAFAPVVARAAWHLLKPAPQLNLRRVGIFEIGYSLTFLVLTTLAFYKT